MKIADSVAETAIWGKSHRVLLLGFVLLVIIVALISWYFISVNATQRIPQATPELIKQLPSSAPTPPLSDTSSNGTTIQSIIQNDNTTPPKTQVHINGQPVPIPDTGTVHKVIQDDKGTTTVDISANNSSSGTSSSSSFTNVNFNSTSSTVIQDSQHSSSQ